MKPNQYLNKLVAHYAKLQGALFKIIIKYLKSSKITNVDQTNALEWQLERLAQQKKLTSETVAVSLQSQHIAEKALNEMFKKLSDTEVKNTVNKIVANTKKKSAKKPPDVDIYTHEAIRKTMDSLNKNVYSSLLSRNVYQNGTAHVYRNIIQKATTDVITGRSSFETALARGTMDWVNHGIPTALTDKAGRDWSIEAYSRMVAETSFDQATNDVRMATMKDNDTTLAYMDWHIGARPDCAYIQGHVVNLVPEDDPAFNDNYDTIYNWEYGEPQGTQGINCRHSLTPFDPDVNELPDDADEAPDPKEAIKNAGIQAQQRSMERKIRQTKKLINASQELDDKDKVSHYKSVLSNQQANIRALVDDHKFLSRDYSREQVYTGGDH